ncbi:MAG: hypothetical protein QE487_15735 [Fluviicola sp.]|nr:hypothetical protein [Fluviicola sp.]
MKHFLVLILLSMLIGSCSITKRRYNTGWHVEWNKPHRTDGETVSKTNDFDQSAIDEPTETSSDTAIIQPVSYNAQETAATVSSIRTEESSERPKDNASSTESTQERTSVLENKSSSTAVIKDEPEEPKKEMFPNSERVIPIPLAILLTILLVFVGGSVSAFIGTIIYLVIAFLIGESLLIAAIGVFFGALVFTMVVVLIFHLYNRKQTKYGSIRERNLAYIWYALGISSGIGLIIWLVSIGLY